MGPREEQNGTCVPSQTTDLYFRHGSRNLGPGFTSPGPSHVVMALLWAAKSAPGSGQLK